MNKPIFGKGKLGDGNAVCSPCFRKINDANPKVAFNLKYQILTDVRNVLQGNSVNYTMSFTREFSEPVSDKFSQPKAAANSEFTSESSVLDQLESLGRIKELGLLTEEEFTEQKKKLLERL
ncbi:SHOCT domain-containing protein [Flavobacterium cerinum]|uniref:SHOCT domain-containing protein n=1 Tax=Flavobacterium cerinum TaxID=2502784 RepID=A0A444GMZ0_9FLAO|nr:SHOCT domain-containing protein [Flavobacterium cerinum]RWW92372.1 hypothetical protein EPI11_15815 [Flavobacterium cerinum]